MKLPATASLLILVASPSTAQELEPGAYSVSPAGVNILLVTYHFAGGDVTFDPALPIEDARATIHSPALAYVRSLRFFGRSANFGFVAPYSIGHLEGRYLGEFTNVDRSGFRDPLVRFAFNLYGAPAMDARTFASYRQETNVGLSVTAAVPLGEYDPSRLVNLGSNRFSLKPELGFSRRLNRWTIEIYGGVWVFSENDDFYGGRARRQDPIGSVQMHLLYTFRPRLWASFDANFYTGGRTSVDGQTNQDLQKNSRAGLTIAVPLDRRQSLKLSYSRGAYTTIGADFHALAVGYQYLWGAGL